jgi:hypothetical protein
MASAIDPTKPADGVPAVKAELRANLAAAKTEIESLQAVKFEAGDPLDMEGAVLDRAELRAYVETSPELAPSEGTLTLDLAAGSVVEVILDQDVASLVLANPPAAGRAGTLTLILRQDGSGGRTLAWPAAVKWAGGQPPALSPDPDAVDIFALVTRDGGTTWYGFVAGLGFA